MEVGSGLRAKSGRAAGLSSRCRYPLTRRFKVQRFNEFKGDFSIFASLAPWRDKRIGSEYSCAKHVLSDVEGYAKE